MEPMREWHSEDLLAHLDGALDAASGQRLEADLVGAEELRSRLSWLHTLKVDCEYIAGRREAALPFCDVSAAVMAACGVDEDSELDPEVLPFAEALESLGAAHADSLPAIDVTTLVMERCTQIADEPDSGDPIQASLIALGVAFAASLPVISISREVMARIDALKDDAVGWDQAVDLAEAGETDAAFSADIAWARELLDDAALLQARYTRRLPKVDVTAAIRAAIPPHESSFPVNVVSLASRRERAGRWMRAGLAIAAGLLITFGGAQLLFPETNPMSATPMQVASIPPEASALENPGDYGAASASATGHDELTSVAPPDLKVLTAETIFASLKKGDEPSVWRERLREWAAIPRQTARDIAAKAETASAPTQASAIASLPAAEQASALLTAIGHYETTPPPVLAVAFAARAAGDPGQSAVAFANLEKAMPQDKGNALPLYMQARILLDGGDLEGALELFRQAAGMTSASAYGLELARGSESALAASGLDAETSAILAALTAGGGQYEMLCNLSDNLLHYARQYAEMGEMETSESILRAVLNLGDQLKQGSQLVEEELAAYDVQRQAAELGREYASSYSPETLQVLNVLSSNVNEGLAIIQGFMDAFNGFLGSASSPAQVSGVALSVLERGSVPLLGMFQEGTLDLSRLGSSG